MCASANYPSRKNRISVKEQGMNISATRQIFLQLCLLFNKASFSYIDERTQCWFLYKPPLQTQSLQVVHLLLIFTTSTSDYPHRTSCRPQNYLVTPQNHLLTPSNF